MCGNHLKHFHWVVNRAEVTHQAQQVGVGAQGEKMIDHSLIASKKTWTLSWEVTVW